MEKLKGTEKTYSFQEASILLCREVNSLRKNLSEMQIHEAGSTECCPGFFIETGLLVLEDGFVPLPDDKQGEPCVYARLTAKGLSVFNNLLNMERDHV